jgi:hypothetical protein
LKRLIILFIVLLAGIGWVLRAWLGQQIDQGVLFSDQYKSGQYCLQFILLIPAFVIGRLALILFPEPVYKWQQDVMPWYGKKYTKGVYILTIRFWGFILLAPIPFAFWPTCGITFGSIFGK